MMCYALCAVQWLDTSEYKNIHFFSRHAQQSASYVVVDFINVVHTLSSDLYGHVCPTAPQLFSFHS